MSGNTILITGGTSGIGIELATRLLKDASGFPEYMHFRATSAIRKLLGFSRAGSISGLTAPLDGEIEIDLAGPVRMVRQFLPQLVVQKTAAAGIRVQLRKTSVKVFELAPPVTQTPLLTKDFRIEDLKFVHPMDLKKMGTQALDGLRKRSIGNSSGAKQYIEADEPNRTSVCFESL